MKTIQKLDEILWIMNHYFVFWEGGPELNSDCIKGWLLLKRLGTTDIESGHARN